MPLIDWLTRAVFGLLSLMLALIGAGLVVYAALQLARAAAGPEGALGPALLEAVGYAVIAVAVFDVAKYVLDEDTLRSRELRHAGEARRSLTRFLSTITIAVFLEALVALFEATKENFAMMIYPTILLIAGVVLIVGLGAYVRLSVAAEKEIGGAKGEAEDEADFEAAQRARD